VHFSRFTDLGFYGVPGKESTFCSPTTNCLVSLTCQPAFVLPLESVERVHFERINFQLKNFDMVFIPKDYTQPVTEVGAIITLTSV
jgi:nucleosome binding factor SPN SPT16 subunit